jgi:glycosyltransferase involved in cell wall biosynthesis
LAKKVSNLAYIKGAIYRKNEIYDYCELPCKFINEKRLTPEEVNDIYNKSYCGGIFSEKEGACYSSSEYLLSGLPVISTLSKGGRDTWYTKDNSIIVSDDEDSIVNAVNICIEKLKSGEFNREKIRNTHIEFTHLMRNNIIEYTKYLFAKHNIEIDAAKYWEKMYFHKFIINVRLEDAILILQS